MICNEYLTGTGNSIFNDTIANAYTWASPFLTTGNERIIDMFNKILPNIVVVVFLAAKVTSRQEILAEKIPALLIASSWLKPNNFAKKSYWGVTRKADPKNGHINLFADQKECVPVCEWWRFGICGCVCMKKAERGNEWESVWEEVRECVRGSERDLLCSCSCVIARYQNSCKRQ